MVTQPSSQEPFKPEAFATKVAGDMKQNSGRQYFVYKTPRTYVDGIVTRTITSDVLEKAIRRAGTDVRVE
ncbi:MAG: hypothetical protein HYY37_06045 [Candidatus Aenigmarchaeota archaeon]|nr:hypothetical protein [Candidatus Aenigmarchaeota archaeon]